MEEKCDPGYSSAKGEDSSDKSSKSLLSRFKKLLTESREAIKVLSGSHRAVRLIWESSPGNTALLLVLTTLLGLMPLAQLFVGKSIVDLVTAKSAQGAAELNFEFIWRAISAASLLPMLALLLTLELAQGLISNTSRYLEAQLGELLNRNINEKLLNKINSFQDIAFFESTEFHDNVQMANDAAYRPMQIMTECFAIFRNSTQLIAVTASLFYLQPLLSIMILTFTLPNLFFQFKHSKETWAINRWQTPEVRKMYYYRMLLCQQWAAAEIRMFGLGSFFIERYLQAFEKFFQTHKKERLSSLKRNIISGSLSSISDTLAYSYLIFRALTGAISIGDFYFLSSALSQMQGRMNTLIWSFAELYQDNLFLNNLYAFLEMPPKMQLADPAFSLKAPKPIKQSIEFKNVSFNYPGSEKEVFSKLNFTIQPGQTVALVGENGAGKTTIVKLLGRLYDPAAGEILIDGINLKDIDLDDWRAQTSVIFQSYMHYQLSASENIGVGQLNFIEDENRVGAAAERGGAAGFIEKLPDKMNTILGGWFSESENCTELSGGQWQKIALSRAFMRAPRSELKQMNQELEKHLLKGSAQVLVLDEPTSSLDVESEHDVYQRFKELTEGKTTVLISHRFSTVKMADRILLLEQGRITEEGSHDELMSLNKEYARLYRLQSQCYN